MTQQYGQECINYACDGESGGGVDISWYPPTQSNGTPAGVFDLTVTLAEEATLGFRVFGEGLSDTTEIELLLTSAPIDLFINGGSLLPKAGGPMPAFTTAFVAATGTIPDTFTPDHIVVTPDSRIPADTAFWLRARNGTGPWVPYPARFVAQPPA